MSSEHVEPPFPFEWRVAESGYAWVSGRVVAESRSKSSRSSATVLAEKPGARRVYSPLTLGKPVYRILASTPATRAAVTSFASEFGTLGSPAVTIEDDGGEFVAGEPLEAWGSEIASLLAAVRLYDAWHTQDESTLAELIRWSGTDAVHYGREIILTRALAKAEFDKLVPGDLVGPARYQLARMVNTRLRVTTRLAWNAQTETFEFRFVPETLVRAIWLQLAQAIAGGKSYRACAACGRPMEIGQGPTSGRRTNARYCDATCRGRAFQRRRQESSNKRRRAKR